MFDGRKVLKSLLEKTKVLALRARPMGQAFLIAISVLILSATLALLLTPSVTTLNLTTHSIPEAYEHGVYGPPVDGRPLGVQFPGCRWSLPDDLGRKALAGPPAPYRVVCQESYPAEEIGHESHLLVLTKRFLEDSDWHVVDYSTSTSLPSRSPPLAVTIYLALPILVTLALLRGLSFRDDLKRAAHVIVRQPWVLAVVPFAMAGGSVVFNTLLPLRIDRVAEAAELLQVIPAGVIAIVLTMPVFEEAVFRQWLYVRTIDRLPSWAVAAGSAWFFMLMHVFNPQVGAMPGYLPTVFVGGLAFFWLRHRFGSFSLAALAHVLNNGLFFYLSKAFSS